MAEERPDSNSQVYEYVGRLKSIVPHAEHAALDSRVEELLNDSSASVEDVIASLREEFNPDGKA